MSAERRTRNERTDVPVTISQSRAMAIVAKLEVGARALERQGQAATAQVLRLHAAELREIARSAGRLRTVTDDDTPPVGPV